MKDRGNLDYILVTRPIVLPANDLRLAKPAALPLRLESPTRQAEKALNFSGRQLKKFRKVQRKKHV